MTNNGFQTFSIGQVSAQTNVPVEKIKGMGYGERLTVQDIEDIKAGRTRSPEPSSRTRKASVNPDTVGDGKKSTALAARDIGPSLAQVAKQRQDALEKAAEAMVQLTDPDLFYRDFLDLYALKAGEREQNRRPLDLVDFTIDLELPQMYQPQYKALKSAS